MDSSTIKLMCAADRAFFPFIPTMLNSVVRNTKSSLEVGVLVQGVAEADRRELERHFPAIKFRFIDVTPEDLGDLYFKMALSPMSYARVLMSDRVPWDKFVYLDIDMLVLGDVRELYETDLEDKPFAACFPNGRLNAGMLVINAAYWRARGLASEVLAYARQHRPKEADQAAIEAICGADGIRLEACWNVLIDPMWGGHLLENPAYFQGAKLLHFITGFKPWNVGLYLLPAELRQLWRDYRLPTGISRDPKAEVRFAVWQAKTLLSEARRRGVADSLRTARTAVSRN
jgi:lipopolysaccharide biosynthesis glycosyltransferase